MAKPRFSSRVRAAWDGVRTSLWFVPTLMMAAAFVLAAIGIWLDLMVFQPDRSNVPWWIYVSAADDARNVLSTLLSSMITMASLVFSITMVVLSLAAGQFGPRLIRTFMASPRTQFVLGTFVMTILYCLIVLTAVGWRGSDGKFSFSTVTIAIVLMGVSIGLLVLFIHTLARSIVSETVIERVGHELDEALAGLEPLENNGPDAPRDEEARDVLPEDFEHRASHFGTKKAGYVQAIGHTSLMEAACACDAMIGLYFGPGDYVARDGRGIAIYPKDKDTPELREKILEAISVGAHRTPVQDVEYSIRHLVEIGVRALSPGINDPYTAVSVVHRLSASLALLMGRTLPPGVFRDKEGTVRVVAPRPHYAGLIGAAFDQIRQNGADKPLIVMQQLEALARIAEHASLPAQFEALRNELNALAQDAEREIANASDTAIVRSRTEETARAIEASEARV